jgi:hypothetical protein
MLAGHCSRDFATKKGTNRNAESLFGESRRNSSFSKELGDRSAAGKRDGPKPFSQQRLAVDNS